LLDLITSYVIRGVSAALRVLPARFVLWLGRRMGKVVYFMSGRRGRITYANLKAAFHGEKSPQELRKLTMAVYMHVAQTFAEMYSMARVDKKFAKKYISIQNLEAALKASRNPGGMIFLSAHFGNWELCTIKSVFVGMPMHLLARDQKMKRTYELLNRIRESKGNKVVRKGMDIKNIFRLLRNGDTIGILGDQNAGVNGKLIDFFGRPASHAIGPFRFAQKSGALVLPAFMHRVDGPYHHVVVEEAMSIPQNEDITPYMERYVRLLEKHIREYPEQWFWMHKKWKITPLKSVLVLDDGKKGHLKQSLAALKLIRRYREKEGYAPEYVRSEVVSIRYRSAFRKAVLRAMTPFITARVQGRLGLLKWALEKESYEKAADSYADVVISCGSALFAVNRILKLENNARSLVIMDPGAACRKKFDVVVVPDHDVPPAGIKGDNVVITDMAPNLVERRELDILADTLKSGKWAKGEKKIGVLAGGDNPDYAFTGKFSRALSENIKKAAEQVDAVVYMTTSRRTPEAAEEVFQEGLRGFARCGTFIKGREDADEKTVEKILAVSDVVLVSGESISMVSEAVCSGRPVMVFMPQKLTKGLTKYERFVEELREKGYLVVVKPEDIPAEMSDILEEAPRFRTPDDNGRITEKLYRLF